MIFKLVIFALRFLTTWALLTYKQKQCWPYSDFSQQSFATLIMTDKRCSTLLREKIMRMFKFLQGFLEEDGFSASSPKNSEFSNLNSSPSIKKEVMSSPESSNDAFPQSRSYSKRVRHLFGYCCQF